MRTRVGVTGHRHLPDAERLGAAVDAVLDEWAGGVLVSALAEGADRLVAARALAREGWQLEALLPLPADDFLDDFETATSRDEFRSLLDRAGAVRVVDPQPTRVDAYLVAGRELVDAVDVLVALWDGAAARGTGGTAEIVAYARDRGRRVEVVPVERDRP